MASVLFYIFFFLKIFFYKKKFFIIFFFLKIFFLNPYIGYLRIAPRPRAKRPSPLVQLPAAPDHVRSTASARITPAPNAHRRSPLLYGRSPLVRRGWSLVARGLAVDERLVAIVGRSYILGHGGGWCPPLAPPLCACASSTVSSLVAGEDTRTDSGPDGELCPGREDHS